jgi:hypothetical protein
MQDAYCKALTWFTCPERLQRPVDVPPNGSPRRNLQLWLGVEGAVCVCDASWAVINDMHIRVIRGSLRQPQKQRGRKELVAVEDAALLQPMVHRNLGVM